MILEIRVPTKTFSASLDAGLIARVRAVAEEENRSQSAVVASALELYTALEPVAHRALEELRGRTDPETIADEVQRLLLRLQWSLLVEETRRSAGEDLSDWSDDRISELADEAVRETRRTRPYRGGARGREVVK